MNSEVTVYEEENKPLTAAEIKAQVQLIQEVMSAVMKEGHHYGTIPGTPKPTLYKPGAEKLLSTFHIGADPRSEIEDLSSADEVRYRVAVKGFTQGTGRLLGAGIGECSSNEEKYKWRKPVCDAEFEETPTERKRIAWKRGDKGPYQQKQIRTQPADVANTVLKMAKKRALIDMTLTITAASDIFDQDLEDMADNGVLPESGGTQKPPISKPQEKKTEKAPEAGIQTVTVAVDKVEKYDGINKTTKKPYTNYRVHSTDKTFKTFSETISKDAQRSVDEKVNVTIEYKTGQYGLEIVNLTVDERAPEPGSEEQ